MPGTGQSHHPECDSYEIPSELSGRGAIQNMAVIEDDQTGLTTLKLNFSLSKVSSDKQIEKSSSTNKDTVKSDATKLSLRALLHVLYEDAELNKWSPNMAGKRSWAVIEKYLKKASHDKVVRGMPISDILLIPEPFSVERKDAISSNHRRFLSTLKKQGSKQRLGLIIGEVKSIEPARFGFKMQIKHMPDLPVFMQDDVHRKIQKNFPTEMSFFCENESIHLLTICTFVVTPSGSPQVDAISFMVVDRNWLPFENIEELELLERLCTEQRYFAKSLRYNLHDSNVIASALLTDTNERATAIYLVPHGASENYYKALEEVIEGSDLPHEVYDPNKEN
jgi:hypothetical protein